MIANKSRTVKGRSTCEKAAGCGAATHECRHRTIQATTTRPILQDFIEPAAQHPAGRRNIQNLYNDYVYFWRWALWKLFENPEVSGPGIITFITAASYLRGPGFVGMRRKMREAFDELWIIDLEGDNLGARKTENVFNIQRPVAIAIWRALR